MGVNSVCSAQLEEVFCCADGGISGWMQIEGAPEFCILSVPGFRHRAGDLQSTRPEESISGSCTKETL